jgi:hypothetical protein
MSPLTVRVMSVGRLTRNAPTPYLRSWSVLKARLDSRGQ